MKLTLKRVLTLTLPGGIQVPVPGWSVSVFGLIAIVAISFGVYRFFYPLEPELVTAQQANRALKVEIDEYNTHIMESPQIVFGDLETLRVTAYEDGCTIVARKFAGKINTRLLVSPAKVTTTARVVGPLVAVLDAQQQSTPKCLNPHPGEFVWRYGERAYGERCWVPVIRVFRDGCEHYQMFNTCTNAWDTLPNGTPNVRWTRCIHLEAQ